MITNFIVTKRSLMNAMVDNASVPYAVITIADFTDEHLNFKETSLNKGVLKLKFRDSDSISLAKHNGYYHEMFTESQAKEILTFLDIKDGVSRDDIETVYVNCLLGRCRSAAVAASISKILFNDDSKYFNSFKFNPNMFVYRTILNTYYGMDY